MYSVPSRFTVVVPTYNRANLLPRCLKSLQAQTFGNFEIIVADDGSRDHTRAVIAEIAAGEPRLRYAYQPNRGAGDARNLGALLAVGEYLVFLDSDDEVLPQWLERFATALAEHHADVACCGCQEIDAAGKVRKIRLPAERAPGRRYGYGYFYTGTFAIRREVFQLTGGYASGLPANQHSEFRLRLLPLVEQHGWKVQCIPEALVRRHSHGGPSIRGNTRAVYESGTFVLEQYGHLLLDNPRSYADWAAAVGGCAARLGDFRSARAWFQKAVSAYPRGLKNYARILITACPGVRSLVYRAVVPSVTRAALSSNS